MTELDAKIIQRAQHLLIDTHKIPRDLLQAWHCSGIMGAYDFLVKCVCLHCLRLHSEHVDEKCLFAETRLSRFDYDSAAEYVRQHWRAS